MTGQAIWDPEIKPALQIPSGSPCSWGLTERPGLPQQSPAFLPREGEGARRPLAAGPRISKLGGFGQGPTTKRARGLWLTFPENRPEPPSPWGRHVPGQGRRTQAVRVLVATRAPGKEAGGPEGSALTCPGVLPGASAHSRGAWGGPAGPPAPGEALGALPDSARPAPHSVVLSPRRARPLLRVAQPPTRLSSAATPGFPRTAAGPPCGLPPAPARSALPASPGLPEGTCLPAAAALAEDRWRHEVRAPGGQLLGCKFVRHVPGGQGTSQLGPGKGALRPPRSSVGWSSVVQDGGGTGHGWGRTVVRGLSQTHVPQTQ